MAGRWWRVPVAAGACVALALASPVGAAPSSPLLPDQLAGYGLLLGPRSVSAGPPGAAMAVYQNGWGVEFMDAPRAIALGADGRSYRSIDSAMARAAAHTQGDPASFALAPDGSFVVIGSARPRDDLALLDLATGQTTSVPLGEEQATRIAAVPGAGIALVIAGDEMGGYRGDGEPGRLLVVDLAGGGVVRAFDGVGVRGAALSPDGAVLAVVAGGRLTFLDARDGGALEHLDSGARPPQEGVPWALTLDGDAWSPDGSRLALEVNGELRVTRPDDRTAADAHAVGGDSFVVLGWRSVTEVVVQETTYDPVDNASEIVAIDLATRLRTVLSRYDPGFTGAAVGRLDLARDLLPHVTVTEAVPEADPLPAIVLGVVGAGGLLAALWWLRRRAGVRRPAARRSG